MRPLLAILFLLLVTPAHGQGFGQSLPFLAKDSSTAWTPQSEPGLAYFWLASDLSDGSVSNWTDKVQSLTFTNGALAPIKDTNGVWFSDEQHYLTGPTITLYSNYVIGTIVRPVLNSGAFSDSVFLGKFNTDRMSFSAADETSTAQWYVTNPSGIPEWEIDDWQDLTFVQSNYTTAASHSTYFYTNGVLSHAAAASSLVFDIDAFGSVETSWVPRSSVYAIFIYTNVNNVSSFIDEIHDYRERVAISRDYQTSRAFVWDQALSGAFNNTTGDLGMEFVPAYDMTITDLGRWIISGNSQTHTLKLKNSAGTVLRTATINASGAPVGYLYGTITNNITLTNRLRYFVESTEINGGDQWYYAATSTITNYYADGIIRGGSVNASMINSGSRSYGPVNFKYY